jgi:hypothetical protein
LATPPTTRNSSLPAPSTLIRQEPYPHPLHEYLSKAVQGHHQIVAAIVNHAEDNHERADAIGELHSS